MRASFDVLIMITLLTTNQTKRDAFVETGELLRRRRS
jgi:hypothetical protein